MMRKTINIILIILHIALVTPVGEVFAYEYRLTASTLSPGKKVDSTNFTLKQTTIGEPFGGKASNANCKVKFGYISSTASNPPLLISSIPDNFPLPASRDLDDYFKDPLSEPLTYTVIGNSSIDVFIDNVTHVVSWEPLSSDFVGSEEVFFIAENNEGVQTRSNSVILTISAAPEENNPPILRHIPDITAYEGETISINAADYGYDFDGDELTYTYSEPFNAEGVWETDYDDAGTYIVKVTVSDGRGGSYSGNVKIAVNNVNQAPVIESVNGVEVINGSVSLTPKDEGTILKLEPYASDPDADPITFRYEAPFNADESWKIPYDFTGTDPTKSFTTKITASDGLLQSSIDVNITVNNKNAAPTVSIISNSYCVHPSPEEFTIHIEANDLDGDELTYVLEENDNDITPVPIPDPFDKTLSKSDAGGYFYTITVTDQPSIGTAETATASCYVEVIDTAEKIIDVFPISGDFNGDGLTDIGTWDGQKNRWAIAFSEGGAFNSVKVWDNIFADFNYYIDSQTGPQAYPITGDFNGDGKTDIGLYSRKTEGSDIKGGSWVFAFSNGKGFDYEELWDVTKFGGGIMSPLIGDFNSDGITDIGYADAVDPNSPPSKGRSWIKLAKKDRTGFEDVTIPFSNDLNDSSTYSGDFNGDGLPDILAFDKDDGIWRVMLGQDATSSQLVDWVQNTGIAPTFIGSFNHGSEGGTYDGDWDSWFGFYDGGSYGSKQSETTMIFEWTEKDIISVKYKCRSHSAIGSSGSHWNYWKVYLKLNDSWTLINNGSGSSGLITDSTGWSNCSGIKIETKALADSNRECNIESIIYEVQAYASSETLASNDLPAFTDPDPDWIPDGFGEDKELVLTDYNHDGKTDIGYLDKDTGEWYYATSDGTKFNIVSDTDPSWPTNPSEPFGKGSDILPSGGDYNGDGIGDAAYFDRSAHGVLNKWKIQLHNSKQPDLLVSIDNGIGGTTNIEYEVSTQFDNTGGDTKSDLPFPVPVVTRVTKTDGMGNEYKINYTYEGGVFESNSREFRGFKYVEVIDAEETVSETWFHQDDIRKGRPEREIIKDKYEQLYSETLYTWHSGGTDDDPVYRMVWSNLVPFPALEAKEAIVYNPHDDTDFKSTRVEYDYYNDDYANLKEVKERSFNGLVLKKTVIDYTLPNTTNWIIGKPAISTIFEGDGTAKVAETRYYYDNGALGDAPTKGSLTKEERWLDKPLEQGGYLATTFGYDTYGNVIAVTDTLGRETETIYSLPDEIEPTYTFPRKVTNALGHTQEFAYDKATGQILTSKDPNGQTTTSEYDGFGRLRRVEGPGSPDPISYIIYEYSPKEARPQWVEATTKIGGGLPDSIAYSYLDGMGRIIENVVIVDNNQQIVSDIVRYDSRGQITKKYLPFYEPEGITPTWGSPPQPTGDIPYVRYFYDSLGRIVITIRPDGKVSQNIYGVTTTIGINEKGQQNEVTKDEYGRIVIVEEANGKETQYEYDTLGNLTDTFDSASPTPNHTHIEYDSLGRKISMDDPDMGSWSYEYDAVGNLVSQTDNKEQIITFEYDEINRLKYKSAGVTYIYNDNLNPNIRPVDTPRPNGIGRLDRVTYPDGETDGETSFEYDILGREKTSTKVVDSASYTIQREYDSLDRLTKVIYPDSTVVAYKYNQRGGIKFVGTDTQEDYFIKETRYDQYGHLEYIKYGNDSKTTYTYDDYTLRLNHLTTTDKNGVTIQNLDYTFDPIGNIEAISDSIYKSNTQTFTYDALNRLISATSGDGGYGAISYAYDSIGNMLKKSGLSPEGTVPDFSITSMSYGENGAGPHAVTSYQLSALSYQLKYDANGNMTEKEYGGGVKTFEYDIENRLIEVGVPKERQVENYTIELNPGWNFVSIPIKPLGAQTFDIANLLGSSNISKAQVSRYNSATQSWENFAYEHEKDLTQYCDFTEFEYGKGYEIYVDGNCTLTVSGITPLSPQTLELHPGWNLIAAPTTTSISTEEALQGLTCTEVRRYNGASYDDVTELSTGEAYFVYLDPTSAATWNIPREQDKTQFVYDGDGGRVKKITEDETTTYIGSSYETSLRATESGEAISIKKHIFMGATRICAVEYDEGDSANSQYRYYHQDHIGSSNVITDETGQLAKLIEYKPYGLTAREEGEYNTNYRFTGKLFDTDTGLYYYGARYYDPELGRFIQPDTIVPYPDDPQSFNRYAYARNNPIRYVDPTGHSWKSFWQKAWKFFAAAAIVVATLVAAVYAPQAIAPMLKAAFFTEFGFGITGATSAALSGGDVGSGLLFGVSAGGITGFTLGAMGPIPHGSVWGAMAQGAVIGTGAGATSGYAGGKGSIGDIAFWAAIGNISTAVLNAIGTALEAANPATEKVNDVTQSGKKLDINKGIDDLSKTEWSHTERGEKVVRALKVAQSQGKIKIGSIGGRTRAYFQPSTGEIVINSTTGQEYLPGRLAHEGTHLVQHQEGLVYGLLSEREAYNHGYLVDKAMGVDAFNPTTEWIRKSYGFD